MIFLVTDSTAYLSREEARELSCLVVPMHVIKDGKTTKHEGFVSDWDPASEKDLSRYTTAQAAGSAFLDVFTRLVSQGHEALCVTISSRLSGTFQNAMQAAKEVGEDRVRVVDSRVTAGGMYLMLKKAREWIDQGLNLSDCFNQLLQMRKRVRTIFTIQDMGPLRRSGRLGAMRSSVSTLLNLRPLLTLQDGSVVSHSLARGRQDQIRQMVLGLSGKPREVIVQSAGDPEGAQELADRLQKKGIQVITRPLGQVLAIHLGLPVLSIAFVEEQEVPTAAGSPGDLA